MAASMSAPDSKLIFEKCSFNDAKSRHNKCIRNKFFNHSVTLVMPDFEKVPEELTSAVDREPYWMVQQLPLSTLIHRDFIEAFVKRGDVYMLSQGTHIDTDNCYALTPDGTLILNIDKDTYEELGLEGKASEFSKKRSRRYVVNVQLTAPYFVPGKKNYERVKWCLTDHLGLTADFLFYWKPHDNSLCPSSLKSYLTGLGHTCSLYSLHQRASRPAFRFRPAVCAEDAQETVDHCSHTDFWEWLGAQAVGAEEGAADDYINTLTCPTPRVAMEKCAVSTFTGFVTPHHVHSLIDRCREHVAGRSGAAPWVAVTVHGFADSPVSWHAWEHGFLQSGDNLYTYVTFPHDNYWMFMSSGAHDTFS